MENLGKKWWIVYGRLRLGKQNNMVLTETNKKLGGTVLGNTPYPLGSAEFSAHLPKSGGQAGGARVVHAGGGQHRLLKQVKSFGMHQQMKIAQPLHWISVAKQGGPELYQDIYGGMNFYWSCRTEPRREALRRLVPEEVRHPARRVRRLRVQRDPGVARGSELARPRNAGEVADALRKSPATTTSRASSGGAPATTSRSRTCGSSRAARRGKTKGDWGLLEVRVARAGQRGFDRTCAEKGLRLAGRVRHLARGAGRPGLHRPGARRIYVLLAVGCR